MTAGGLAGRTAVRRCAAPCGAKRACPWLPPPRPAKGQRHLLPGSGTAARRSPVTSMSCVRPSPVPMMAVQNRIFLRGQGYSAAPARQWSAGRQAGSRHGHASSQPTCTCLHCPLPCLGLQPQLQLLQRPAPAHRSGMCLSLKLKRPTPARLASAPTNLQQRAARRKGRAWAGIHSSRRQLYPPCSSQVKLTRAPAPACRCTAR